jgi:hypothetical protein
MKTIITLALVLAGSSAAAQPEQIAPGWYITGGWQCGPYVRVTTSVEGGAALSHLRPRCSFDGG